MHLKSTVTFLLLCKSFHFSWLADIDDKKNVKCAFTLLINGVLSQFEYLFRYFLVPYFGFLSGSPGLGLLSKLVLVFPGPDLQVCGKRFGEVLF